jgi:hypothetical protein
VQYDRSQALLYETPAALPEDKAPEHARIRQVLAAARPEGREHMLRLTRELGFAQQPADELSVTVSASLST